MKRPRRRRITFRQFVGFSPFRLFAGWYVPKRKLVTRGKPRATPSQDTKTSNPSNPAGPKGSIRPIRPRKPVSPKKPIR